MKASLILSLAVISAASLAAVIPVDAGDLLHRGRRMAPEWNNTNYYDPAWGMPEAIVVPPTVRWQSNYAWGASGSRLTRVNAQYQVVVPGPASAYDQRGYLPAPPQPSDTQQFGISYVRGPRR